MEIPFVLGFHQWGYPHSWMVYHGKSQSFIWDDYYRVPPWPWKPHETSISFLITNPIPRSYQTPPKRNHGLVGNFHINGTISGVFSIGGMGLLRIINNH